MECSVEVGRDDLCLWPVSRGLLFAHAGVAKRVHAMRYLLYRPASASQGRESEEIALRVPSSDEAFDLRANHLVAVNKLQE